MLIIENYWIDHLQGSTLAMNRQLGLTVQTFAQLSDTDIAPTEALFYLDDGDDTIAPGDSTIQVILEGTRATVVESGDVYVVDAEAEWVLYDPRPRYKSPTTTAEFNDSEIAFNAKDIDVQIDKNVTGNGHAWIPITVSGRFYSKGEIAYKFNVTDTSAIAATLQTPGNLDTVKLMVKESNSPTFDIDESGTFEANGYTPVYTLDQDSGNLITNRRSLFGSSTTNATYYSQSVSRLGYLHFAWYLEKNSSTGELVFGGSGTLPTAGLTRSTALTNAYVSFSLQRDRTRLELGLNADIDPDVTMTYAIIFPEQGSTFNPSSPNTNVDYAVFSGADVTKDTNVSSPLASKWVVDVSNVTSDLNFRDANLPTTFSGGEIRSGLTSGFTGHGVTVDDVELDCRYIKLINGEHLA